MLVSRPYPGWIVNFEANYDDRFDLTGLVNLQIRWGVNARGAEYALTATDLDPTIRNDHIVRVQQDLVLAIDPDTGRPYNVFHVDNTADPAFATGAIDTRFTNLLDAQNASGPDDIIFVHEGDGTTRNYDRGIVLQEGQYLLGDGVRHEIPVQNGQVFVLCNDVDGNVPTITNRNGGPVVTLAGRNIVRGFNIDATTGGVTNAIQGDGTLLGRTLDNGIIADINILGNPILNGVFHLTTLVVTGDLLETALQVHSSTESSLITLVTRLLSSPLKTTLPATTDAMESISKTTMGLNLPSSTTPPTVTVETVFGLSVTKTWQVLEQNS